MALGSKGSHSFTCHSFAAHCAYRRSDGEVKLICVPGWLVIYWGRFFRTGTWSPIPVLTELGVEKLR